MNQNTVKSSVVIPVQDIEITKRIGEGGYGNVYKGLWVNTEVAIKSLKTAEGSFEFEKEAAILSRLRHPNIVSFYGVCITETSKYMITEFVKKGSLDKIIYKCKQNIEFLSLKEKINILIGVSNGMNYLHSLQPSVIHRDLKPANILLDESNNCKVCDFGLVKIIGNNQLQTSMTVNVGTLFYIGNEGLQGSSTKITHKVDVYSFGIVMYELYFLENPYLNAASSKIHHFRKATCEDQPYTVPMKVLNNERPIIPFRNDEELHEWMNVYGQETSAPFSVLKSVTEDYTKLMQQCWDMDPSNRPEFSDISKQLIQLRDKLSF
ncbi:predicted protein [Naegleria gruberi]|uniref:non-specific serine/threonine protein kinase n=1 Tax=Naegleria gruberi TaxID=5762 RepID=D2V347_NAEGR|nr:uncharacterized protein NAEGRDRAFT_30678 [Naegleria gruberi]EFC48713.1 predicted protein [Naegleria gruberi]|eukprot:XP_002681457.1 predicted protein [Naegleria gruberi strain NEG-M]